MHIFETICLLLNEFSDINAEEPICFVRSRGRSRLLLYYRERPALKQARRVAEVGRPRRARTRGSERAPLTYSEALKTEKVNNFPAILSITGVGDPRKLALPQLRHANPGCPQRLFVPFRDRIEKHAGGFSRLIPPIYSEA